MVAGNSNFNSYWVNVLRVVGEWTNILKNHFVRIHAQFDHKVLCLQRIFENLIMYYTMAPHTIPNYNDTFSRKACMISVCLHEIFSLCFFFRSLIIWLGLCFSLTCLHSIFDNIWWILSQADNIWLWRQEIERIKLI